MKALVIDDDPDVIEVVSLAFERSWPGAVVVSATDGDAGIEMVKTEAPSVVILDIGLPEAPPMFLYSDPEISKSALTGAGFQDPEFTRLDLEWSGEKPEDVLEMIYKSIVRAPMVLERQTPEVKEVIHAEILEKAAEHRRDGKIRLAFPAALFTATKP